MTEINSEEIITKMKERIPKDPQTKKYFDMIVAKGVDEDTALDILIYTWLTKWSY